MLTLLTEAHNGFLHHTISFDFVALGVDVTMVTLMYIPLSAMSVCVRERE